MKRASIDNVTVVDVAYSINKSGITLSFACPIGVVELNEISEMGKMFVAFVKKNYAGLIRGSFVAKSSTPYIFSREDEIFMIWSFTGVDDKYTKQQLRNKKIRMIDYEK